MAVKKKAPIKRKSVKKKASAKRKPASKRAVSKKPRKKENAVGEVTHYFPKVRAAVIKLKASLVIGDTVKVKGHTTDFTQQITSMQIEHVPINEAKKGQEIGLLVNSRVRRKDTVYKL